MTIADRRFKRHREERVDPVNQEAGRRLAHAGGQYLENPEVRGYFRNFRGCALRAGF